MSLRTFLPRALQLGASEANNYFSQWLCYTCACIGLVVLWVVDLIYWCGGNQENFVWSIQWSPPLLHPLLSAVYQCDRYPSISSLGYGGSWLGFLVLPVMDAVSILELAANIGRSKMSEAPVAISNVKVTAITYHLL